MELLTNALYVEKIMEFARTGIFYGFLITTVLQFLGYGIFRALSFVNIKQY